MFVKKGEAARSPRETQTERRAVKKKK